MTEHKLTTDRHWTEWFGLWCTYRYQSRCTCGWRGDKTKSLTQAHQQAEWHAGERLDMVGGWR